MDAPRTRSTIRPLRAPALVAGFVAGLAPILVAGLVALAVAGCRALDEIPRPDRSGQTQLTRPGAVAPPAGDPLHTIARLEDARSDGDGTLQLLLARGAEETRRRAALALGRLPGPDWGRSVTLALGRALDDPAPAVRAAAAFALGLRGDPQAADALLGALDDADPLVRARAVEAASRLRDARLWEEALFALSDPELVVRIEGAIAPHRFDDPALIDTEVVDGALVHAARRAGPPSSARGRERAEAGLAARGGSARDAGGAEGDSAAVDHGPAEARAGAGAGESLAGVRGDGESHAEGGDAGARGADGSGGGVAGPADPEVYWRAVFALQRRASPRARELYREVVAADAHPLAVLFAVKGLGRQPQLDAGERELLHRALAHPDWRVAYEATVALGAHPAEASLAALATAAGHATAHVRRGALEALGAGEAARTSNAVAVALDRAVADPSASARAAALVTAARLRGARAAPDLELRALDRDPVIRVAVAAAAEHLPAELALDLLERLARDRDRLVAGRAVAALGTHLEGPEGNRVRELLRRVAVGDDNGLRLAAIDALRRAPVAGDLAALETAWRTSRGDVSSEIAFNVLEIAAEIGGERGLALVERGLDHDDPYVFATARRLLRAHAPDRLPIDAALPRTYAPALPPEGAAPTSARRPRVEISTSRGRMLFELWPDVAPLHVHNFLALAAEDHYDDLIFHRVVPDFVIQGGDRRGDGNGNVTWHGGSLRAELNPRKFDRGTLGMPRNADPESGGSQIFVTHRPTPHLDGRYTVFGQLLEGGDVLDAIEVGDVILDVRLRE